MTNYAVINRSDQNQFFSNCKILAFEAYLELQPLHSNVASIGIDKRRFSRLYKISMTFNLILMTRHNERLDVNGAGPTEYRLTKLSNLTLHRRLTTCKTHHSNYVSDSNKRFGKE